MIDRPTIHLSIPGNFEVLISIAIVDSELS